MTSPAYNAPVPDGGDGGGGTPYDPVSAAIWFFLMAWTVGWFLWE